MLDYIEVNTHSSIRLALEQVVYIDPFRLDTAPHDADLILITHSHFDHFSPEDIERVRKPDTLLVCPQTMQEAETLGMRVRRVSPQAQLSTGALTVQTVPAYNRFKPFHPKAKGWVGYLLDSPARGRIYIAGDTDMTGENSRIGCDIALLPIGGTYTMDAKQAAKLANVLRPAYVIPVHYGSIAGKPTDAEAFRQAVDRGIEVVQKIRKF